MVVFELNALKGLFFLKTQRKGSRCIRAMHFIVGKTLSFVLHKMHQSRAFYRMVDPFLSHFSLDKVTPLGFSCCPAAAVSFLVVAGAPSVCLSLLSVPLVISVVLLSLFAVKG